MREASNFVPTKYFGDKTDVWGCTNENCNRSSRLSQLEIKVLDGTEQIMWGRFGDASILFPLCNHCGASLAIIYNKTGKNDTTLNSLDGQLGPLM